MKTILKHAPWLVALALTAACMADAASTEGDDTPAAPIEASEPLFHGQTQALAATDGAEVESTEGSVPVQLDGLLIKDYCCEYVDDSGIYGCADYTALVGTAGAVCSNYYDGDHVVGGSCRNVLGCPQYVPPPPPRKPGYCAPNEMCCAFSKGLCIECEPKAPQCR
jgi:hypothetical protein